MQDFDFTLRTVANMHRDTAIVGIQSPFRVAAFKFFGRHAHHRAIFQIQNIGLDIVQQAVRRDFNKRIHVAFA